MEQLLLTHQVRCQSVWSYERCHVFLIIRTTSTAFKKWHLAHQHLNTTKPFCFLLSGCFNHGRHTVDLLKYNTWVIRQCIDERTNSIYGHFQEFLCIHHLRCDSIVAAWHHHLLIWPLYRSFSKQRIKHDLK